MQKAKYYVSIDVDDSNFNVALIKTVGEGLFLGIPYTGN